MVAHGYGFFYCIEEDALTFNIIQYVNNESDSEKLYETMCEVLNEIKSKCMSSIVGQNGTNGGTKNLNDNGH